MKPRMAAICAIVAFATCGGRAPAQFPGCAYIWLSGPCPFTIKAQGDCPSSINIDAQEVCQDCQQGAQAWYVVNNRKDGPVKVTIRVELWNVVPGNRTFTDQVLTLAPGERRKLGCTLPPPADGGYFGTPTNSVQWTESDGSISVWVFYDWGAPRAPGVTWSVEDCQCL